MVDILLRVTPDQLLIMCEKLPFGRRSCFVANLCGVAHWGAVVANVADPDSACYLNADPDLGSLANSNPT